MQRHEASIETAMLYRADVVGFFEDHRLIPGRECIISYNAYLLLLFDALALNNTFYHFMVEAFVPTDHGQMRLDIDSWQELMSCYVSFVADYTKDRRCQFAM
jgi:hypothetical protein